MTGEINAVAWTLWFVAVAILPLTSRNPLYLALLLLVVLVAFFSLPLRAGRSSAWRLFAYVGSGVALLSVSFNVLTVHVGDRQFASLPDGIPIVGGPLTINALVYGAVSATAIATVLFAAATFNSAVRHADLVRMLPASLSRFGVAAGIALLFVPQTIAAGRDIYDAQRARGHNFRGVRDAQAFVVPLLSTAMERALLLSEALETRGFGSSAVVARPATIQRALTLGAAAALVAALFAIGTGTYPAGIALVLTAGVLSIYGTPTGNQRSRYRVLEWNTASLAVAGGSAISMGTLLFGRAAINLQLTYDTFPRIGTPGFNLVAGAAILLLLAPALVRQP